MKLIQLLLLAFVLLAIIKVSQKYKQREINLLEFLFWTLIWIGVAIIVTFPETTQFLADLLGIGRGADLIMYVGLTFAFYLILRIHLTLDHLEQQLTELVRAIALSSLKAQSKGRRSRRSLSKEARR